MDPHVETSPGLALPKPAPEQGVYNAAHETMQTPVGYNAMPQQSSITPPVPPVMQQPAVSSTPPRPTAQASVAPADDNTDALDEEWIHKAKAIVEQTRHDPFLESNQLSRVKADYLRIRYNKHIKVAEEQSK